MLENIDTFFLKAKQYFNNQRNPKQDERGISLPSTPVTVGKKMKNRTANMKTKNENN